MQQPLWLKFVVVFVYQGLTAVLPLVITLLSKNPSYLLLVPALQAGWQTLEKYLTGQGLLGAQSDNGTPNVWH